MSWKLLGGVWKLSKRSQEDVLKLSRGYPECPLRVLESEMCWNGSQACMECVWKVPLKVLDSVLP